jgi:hypothetical protein
MRYNLSGQKKSTENELPSSLTVSYSENGGIEPKGCISLSIRLYPPAEHSAEELINILKALPRSVVKLELPWHDDQISATAFIGILSKIPRWVTSLSFIPSDDKCLSVRDLTIMPAIPNSCTSFWYRAFDIRQANDLILLLESLPPSISDITLFQDNLKCFSQQELSLVSNAVPATVKCLTIANKSRKQNISADDMIKILAHTPSSIVDLRCYYFYSSTLSVSDAKRVLKTTPSFVSNFSLSLPTSDEFDMVIANQNQLLRAIPTTVTNLSIDGFLSSNEKITPTATDTFLPLFVQKFFGTKLSKVISAVETLPSSVKKLHLRNLENFPASYLIEIMRAMPPSVSELTLDFSRDVLSANIQDFATALRMLPSTIKKLQVLGITHCFWYPRNISGNNLITLYKAVPATVENCDIGNKHRFCLKSFTPEDIISFLRSLPQLFGDKLKFALDFPQNVDQIDLLNILPAIPSFITTLSLQNMAIGELPSAAVSNILGAIPASVRSLDFRGNNLSRLGVDGIVSALQSIPSGITHLDLRDNYLHNIYARDRNNDPNLTADNLVRILQAIPKHITHVYMDYEAMQKMQSLMRGGDSIVALNLCYAFTEECFVRVELNKQRLTRITINSLPAAVLHSKVAPYLSFKELSSVVQAAVIKDVDSVNRRARPGV